MSKLGTKNIKTESTSVQKTIEPGNVVAKINSITLEAPSYKPEAYNVVLSLETEDMGEGFEGFLIDKDRPELGRYKGKVGFVKATLWPFADGSTKSGVEISRDMEILKFIKQFCKATNAEAWFDAQDEKHDTIESFVGAFNADKPFAKGNEFLNFCVAGKEYKNKGGYTVHDLFLPKFVKDGNAIESLDVLDSKLIKFNKEEHIVKKKVEAVSSFAPASTEEFTTTSDFITSASNNDFDL